MSTKQPIVKTSPTLVEMIDDALAKIEESIELLRTCADEAEGREPDEPNADLITRIEEHVIALLREARDEISAP